MSRRVADPVFYSFRHGWIRTLPPVQQATKKGSDPVGSDLYGHSQGDTPANVPIVPHHGGVVGAFAPLQIVKLVADLALLSVWFLFLMSAIDALKGGPW